MELAFDMKLKLKDLRYEPKIWKGKLKILEIDLNNKRVNLQY